MPGHLRRATAAAVARSRDAHGTGEATAEASCRRHGATGLARKRGLRATLLDAGLDAATWMDEAQERGALKEIIKKLADKMESGPLDSLDKGAYR